MRLEKIAQQEALTFVLFNKCSSGDQIEKSEIKRHVACSVA